MSEPGLRERKKLRTRRAILEATLRLIEQQGYDATTVEQIAAEAEVSPSTFFRYFPTKEDAVLQDEYDPLIVEAMQDEPGDRTPVEAARSALGGLLAQIYARDKDKLLLRVRLSMEVPALRARMASNLREAEDVFAGAIATQTGGAPDDFAVRIAAATTLAAAGRTFEIWAEQGGTADLPALLDEALALLEHGLDLR